MGLCELHGQACLDNFTKGKSNFVLELNDSVSSGATFLSSPNLDRARDCIEACCRAPGCNLALVEMTPDHDDLIHSCFLLNCIYKQEFVCKLARKEGFLSYVLLDVSSKYLQRWEVIEGEWLLYCVQCGSIVLILGPPMVLIFHNDEPTPNSFPYSHNTATRDPTCVSPSHATLKNSIKVNVPS